MNALHYGMCFLHQWLSVKLRLSLNMYAYLHKHLHYQ